MWHGDPNGGQARDQGTTCPDQIKDGTLRFDLSLVADAGRRRGKPLERFFRRYMAWPHFEDDRIAAQRLAGELGALSQLEYQ